MGDKGKFVEFLQMLSIAYDGFSVTEEKARLWYRFIGEKYKQDVIEKAGEHWIVHNNKQPTISDILNECYEIIRG